MSTAGSDSPPSSEGDPDETDPTELDRLLPRTVDPSNISLLNEKEDSSAKNTILGMIMVAVGTGFVCTVGAIVQSHGGSVLQIMEGRYLIQNLISVLWWKFRKPANTQSWYGDPPFRANIWVRGMLYWAVVFTWWRGLELVALGDAESILFLSPVLTVLVARYYLKESLPKIFPVTVVFTIAGVVFVCQPPFLFGEATTVSAVGFVFLMACCLSWTATSILVRTAKDAHWLQLEIVSSGQALWVWTPLLILLNRTSWQSDTLSGGGWDFKLETIGLILLVGVLGFCGLCLNVIGYQIGDATKVAWMEYLDLVFAFLYQWLVFKEPPNKWELTGVCLLLTCCGVHLLEEFWRWNKEGDEEVEKEEEEMIEADANASESSSIAMTDGLGGVTVSETAPLLQGTRDRIRPVRQLSYKEKLTQIFERMTIFSIHSTE